MTAKGSLAISRRAQEDARQTELVRQAWADSGKVYGYRKLTDGLRDQGAGQIHGFLTMGGAMPETTTLIGETTSALRKRF